MTEEHGCGIGPIIFGTDSYDSWVTEYGSSLSGSEEDESKWEWGDSQQEMKVCTRPSPLCLKFLDCSSDF